MKRALWLSPLVLLAALWPAPTPKKPVYLGAQACGHCHEGASMGHQYSKWLTTKHARAYAVLALPESIEIARISGIRQDPQKAAICLGCHAVASDVEPWERDDAFRMQDGMQCEGCHGAGSEYASEAVMRDRTAAMKAGLRMPGEAQCLVCHIEKGSHVRVLKSAPFDFVKWKEQIAHFMPRDVHRPRGVEVTAADTSSEQAWARWRMGPHSRAYGSLGTGKAREYARQMNQAGDPVDSDACLKCHAPLETKSDGVGCAVCHDKSGAKPTTEVCKGCHNPAHGKSFVLAAALKKVAHGKPLTPVSTEPLYKNPLRLAQRPGTGELWVTYENANAVGVVDASTRKVLAELPVGQAPTGICFSPDGRTAYITNRMDDTLSVVDADSRKILQTVETGDEPHGVLTDRSGKTLYVLNTALDDIWVYDGATLKYRYSLKASNGPWSGALSPDGTKLLVTNTYSHDTGLRAPLSSEITVVETERARIDDRWMVEGTNLLTGVAWHPSGEFALATMNRTKNLVPMTRLNQGWTITNGLAVIHSDGRIDQFLLDEPNLGFADATDVAFTVDGRFALVTSSGTDRVAVVDIGKTLGILKAASEQGRVQAIPNHLGVSAQVVVKTMPTGRSPRGVNVIADGQWAFVANSLDDSLSVIDLRKMEPAGTIDLGGPKEISQTRRGERLFHNAGVSFRRQFSCHSCHPDGHVDRITYDIEADGIGISPVDNRTLRGIQDTAPFKWEGTNPSLQRQCGARLAVFFTRGLPFSREQLEDLDHYITTIPRPENRYRKPGAKLTPAQARGRVIFERTMTNDGRMIPPEGQCAFCHPAPYYTNRRRFDVGTKQASDRQGSFDVPHLNNVYDSAPYLHNGMAKTLEEIWTLFNPYDKHGFTNDMTKDQLNDLIEYLKTL